MHLRHLHPVALAALLVGVAPGVARADDVPRVGVVVAVHVNLNADEASALGGALGAVLRETLVVDVVAGEEAQRRLPDGGVEELCLTRPECVRDIAARPPPGAARPLRDVRDVDALEGLGVAGARRR